MATSRRNSRIKAGQRGFTLFELLVTLTISALAATAMVGLVRQVSPGFLLMADAEKTASDLRRAALEARRSGTGIELLVTEEGYIIATLDIERRWPEPVTARWTGSGATGSLTLSPFALAYGGAGVSLARGSARIDIIMQPVSGRVDVLRR